MIIPSCLERVRSQRDCVRARRNLDIPLPSRWLKLVNYCMPYLFLYPCMVLRIFQWLLLFNLTSRIIVFAYLLYACVIEGQSI